MQRANSVAFLVTAGVLSLLSVQAHAAQITSLYNTGVDNTGTVLGEDATDPHYSAVSVPAPYDQVGTPPNNTSGASNFTGPGIVATSAGGFPIPPWVEDSAQSAWVTPAGDTVGPGGNYAWRTTFDLTEFIPSTAVISGRWSSDNGGVDILVNGNSTGQTNAAQFGGFSGFSIDAAFLTPGINTLSFIVNNGAGEANETGPTGVRVEFDQRDAAPIPEPASLSLLGWCGVALLARRRRP